MHLPIPGVSFDSTRGQGFSLQHDWAVSLSVLGMRPSILSVSPALAHTKHSACIISAAPQKRVADSSPADCYSVPCVKSATRLLSDARVSSRESDLTTAIAQFQQAVERVPKKEETTSPSLV